MFSKMFDNINDSESELSVHGFYLTQLVMEHQLFGSLRAATGSAWGKETLPLPMQFDCRSSCHYRGG